MAEVFSIVPLDNKWCEQIAGLILPIQQIEFNVPITLEDQPDLLDIEAGYLNGGGFWGVVVGEQLVGTIAFIATGHNACALRKMFVHKNYRGGQYGLAQLLLNTLLADCRAKQITNIYLGTVSVLKAACRFYEKNGFEAMDKANLPSYFPLMAADNVFYHLHLTS